MTALILTAVLIVEASVLIHSLRGRTHVPLEYVCAVDTSRNDHHEKYDPIWRTNCFPDTTKPVPKELLEHFFECDLTGVDFEYTKLIQGISEKRTAYEVSVLSARVLEDVSDIFPVK